MKSLCTVLCLLCLFATTANAKSCFWSSATFRSCTRAGIFILPADEILAQLRTKSRGEIIKEFQKNGASSKTSRPYSYKLGKNLERLNFEKDGRSLFMFFDDGQLIDVAAGSARLQQVAAKFDFPLNTQQDILLKLRYKQPITQGALQAALGKPGQVQYFISPLYESPVYQLTYAPASYFILENQVLHAASNEAEAQAYLKLIAAYDPLAQEIVLTQDDVPQASLHPTVSIWDKSGPALFKLLKNKTREYVLYSVENVSDKDAILRSAKGGEYALVEYHNDGQYRKFLFKAETPQTFINVATNAADALAVNRKYGVSLAITLPDFENSFPAAKTVETEEETLTVYQLDYAAVNSKKTQPLYLVFEQDSLTLTFDSRAKLDAHLKEQADATKKEAEEKRKAKEEAARQAQEARDQVKPQPKPYKALVSGGTVTDRMYMPIVTHPKDGKITQPKLTQPN